jgi:hypothetical protein
VAGESCTRQADCDFKLTCVGGICVADVDLSTLATDASIPSVGGLAGESCRSRSDCLAHLSCIEGVCAAASFGVQPSSKRCSIVECREPRDCCPAATDNCPELKAACDMADPTSLVCTRYEATCQCDGSAYSCTEGRCELMFTCSDLVLCPGLLVCDSGTCVRCISQSDCPGGTRCTDNECGRACEQNADCPIFNQCIDGACIDVGCQTDRECKAFLNNSRAECASGECVSACSSDLNCGAAEGSEMVCMSGSCTPIGCETDEECRIRRYRTLQEEVGTTAPSLPISPTVLDPDAYAVECREVSE